MNKLLGLCDEYTKLWKLEFSVEKCNWTVFGKENFEGAKFYLNSKEIKILEKLIKERLYEIKEKWQKYFCS